MITISIFYKSTVEAAARFTRLPPDKLYVVKGETARFLWDFHVDDRDTDLFSESPRWFFINFSNITTIGFDSKSGTIWKFFHHRKECPVSLCRRRVNRESNATLVITGVSTADNGEYRCVLVLKSGNPDNSPTSNSELVVTGM